MFLTLQTPPGSAGCCAAWLGLGGDCQEEKLQREPCVFLLPFLVGSSAGVELPAFGAIPGGLELLSVPQCCSVSPSPALQPLALWTPQLSIPPGFALQRALGVHLWGAEVPVPLSRDELQLLGLLLWGPRGGQ